MLRPFALLSLSLLCLPAHPAPEAGSGESPAIGLLAGLSGNFLTSHGLVLEADFGERFAVQYQYYDYHEFQGLFPHNESKPYEEYSLNGLNAGVYIDNGRYRLGAFLGAQRVSGVVRGKYVRTEEWANCGWFGGPCTDSGYYRIYEEKALDRFLFPLKASLGVHWGWFGLSVSPQVYYYDERLFWHLEFNALFGEF